MKRLIQLGASAAAIALYAAAATTVFAAPAKTQEPVTNFPDGTYTIGLNGYCDVITIVKPGAAGAPGVQASDDPNCLASNMIGVANNHGIEMYWESTGTPSTTLLISRNGTWTLYYDSTGTGVEGIFNSGTWQLLPPFAPSRTGLPSAASHAGQMFGANHGANAGGAQLPGPLAAAIDISFDGFCDGEHLNLPGSAGGPGIDGVQSGCASNPLIGAGGGGMVGMVDYMDGLFYALMPNHTWVLYNDCGDGTECFLNSGTWSTGVPAAPTKNRIPSSGR